MNPTPFLSTSVSGRAPLRHRAAFTFIELIIVVAIVGIMGALAIGHFANAAGDSREIVARQQQAAVQTAVNAWMSGQVSTSSTVSEVRATYNAAKTSEARLALVKDYLDDASYLHFKQQSDLDDSTHVVSGALRKLGWHISLPDWTSGSYPKVELVRK